VVGAGHPLGERDRIGLAELAQWPMVLLDWPLSREYFLSIFSDRGRSPTVAHRARSMDMVRGLVVNGFGFSLFNTPLAALETPEANGLKALRLEEDAQPLIMGLACLRGLRPSPAAEAMHRLARDPEARGDVFAPLGTGLAEAADD